MTPAMEASYENGVFRSVDAPDVRDLQKGLREFLTVIPIVKESSSNEQILERMKKAATLDELWELSDQLAQEVDDDYDLQAQHRNNRLGLADLPSDEHR